MKLYDLAFAKTGVLPVINIPQIDAALPLAEALMAGGLDALEVTLRSECSLEAIRLIKDTYPQMCVGAGTVMSVETVDKAIEAGADFNTIPCELFTPLIEIWSRGDSAEYFGNPQNERTKVFLSCVL